MKYFHKLLACLFLAVAAASASGQLVNVNHMRNSPLVFKAFREVVAKPTESVVRVQCDGKDAAFGTIVGADGWIITKASELTGKILCKFKDGKSYEAKIVGVHKDYDLALLKVPTGGLSPVFWRDSHEATVGKWIAVVGLNPDPVSVGVVGVGTRSLKGGDQPPIRTPSLSAGFMGIGLDLTAENAKINSVAPKGPAERAKLKVGDIVLEAAGRAIPDSETLIATIQQHKAKDVIILKVKRGEEERELPVTLDPIPKEMLGNKQDHMGSILSARRGGFPTILQHDAVIKPSDCGGPLVDLDGKTVGVNISRAGRTETYAIPSEDVVGLLTKLKSGELAPKVDVTSVKPIVPIKITDLIVRSFNKLVADDKSVEDRHTKSEQLAFNSGAYTIELSSPAFLARVIVTDLDGNKLAEEQATGANKTAKLVFEPKAAGNYLITITTTQPGAVGAYTLTVRRMTTTPAKIENKKKAA